MTGGKRRTDGRWSPRRLRGGSWLIPAVVLSASMLGVPAPAHAEPSESELAAARTLGVEGVKLASAGKCSEAIRLLERAAELYAAPTILVPLARCQLEQGELVSAVKVLRKVLDTELPADAPKPFVEAQNEAESLLASALPRLPRLTIKIEVLGDTQPRVSVDGKAISASELGGINLDPGLHQVRAEAAGYLPGAKAVKLKEGDRAEVTLILKPRPAEAPDPAPSDPIAPPASDPEQDAAHDPTLTWVALGVGAAGILVGGVTGLIAAQKESQLAEDCPNGKCPPTSDADLANTKTFALASTIGFAVGVVGLGVGGYLWFFEAGDSGGATTARHGPRVGAFIGVSRVGLTGEF
ncbi:MAG: hypothetical protein R3B89_18695 [Polyangiaceae bacterium]